MTLDPRQIFSLLNEAEFDEIALKIFQHQIHHNKVYKNYFGLLKINPDTIVSIDQIRFLPIELFKSNEVVCEHDSIDYIFTSSGTTSEISSRHFVKDISLYEESFLKCFELFYGNPEQYCFLFLLPSYLEREGSSLIYMAQTLINKSGDASSGFYLNNYNDLIAKIKEQKKKKEKTVLFGVTYALLDLAAMDVALDENFIVFETGGMKGRRKEMVKSELHELLKKKLHVTSIHSEYGMTELLSQAYSKSDGIFKCPPWMKILIRDPYSPYENLPKGRAGAINVIDLANFHSCSFIETQDLGRDLGNGTFELLGRMNEAQLRGCNLMIE